MNFYKIHREPINIIKVPDNNIHNKFHDQYDLTSEQLYKLINSDNNNNSNLTYEEEKQLLNKIMEFSKNFYDMKSEIYKSKRQSEEKARNHYEYIFFRKFIKLFKNN